MVKVSGSYESVVRGVSQQVPQDRLSGQHHAQVNMVSDPVRGLARRHPSVLQDEALLSSPASFMAALLNDTRRHKASTFFVNGTEYDLVHRTEPDTFAMGKPGFGWCFDKAARQFIPIVYNTGDATLDALVAGGVSATVNVGRFLFLAGNTITPTYTAVDEHGAAANKRKMAVWVRGGAYSRNFKVTLTKADGTKIVGEYKTVSASYQGTLDTSDILATDPEYQKKVNDRVNAYNGQVTLWIGTSAADITPENIAQKIVDDLVAQSVTASRYEGTVVIDDAAFIDVAAEDGGDGSLIRAVGNKVSNLDLMSAFHFVGKVVKVEPERSGEGIYLKAFPKDEVSTGFTEVVWKEAAGYKMTPTVVFCLATVHAGSLYIAGSPAGLAALTGLTVPAYASNEVGDQLSTPAPDMFGKKINYLGLFQDRLVIGSGATLLFSRPGDYFNWFRLSAVTVGDGDPWEGYALGAEDDVIRYSVLYDRNLFLYGDRFQYSVNGRQMFSAKTASIVIAGAYADATDAAPVTAGNFLYFAKHVGEDDQTKRTSLHQLQPGVVADSPEPFELSQPLDDYLAGKPVEIASLTAPNMLLLRTDADRNGVYTYSYLDAAGGSERLFDSWSRWQWDSAVGNIIGLSTYKGGILVYTLRSGTKVDGTQGIWVACERFVRDSALATLPYADSLRPATSVTTPATDAYIHPTSSFAASACIAVASGTNRLLGNTLDNLASFLTSYSADLPVSYVGIQYPAYVTPTNPYTRDRNGKAILTGRLTLGRVMVSVADTSGMAVVVTDIGGDRTSLDFSGFILGSPPSLIGTQPIVTTQLSAVIGKEIRECTYTLKAKKWLPLTVTAIEWVGQVFNNVRRA